MRFRLADILVTRFGGIMFFRFAAALMLVVAVSMAQVGLEKQSLRLRRQVSRQYYQMDELLELHAQLRLDIQKLSAPSQYVADGRNPGDVEERRPLRSTAEKPLDRRSRRSASSLPLLRWERPVRPDGAQR